MKLQDIIKDKLKAFLDINVENNTIGTIETKMDHDTLCNVEEIMYRSDPYELSQCFQNLGLGNGMFWSQKTKKGTIKKSSQLFPDILDRHSDILMAGFNGIEFEDKSDETLANSIFTEEQGQLIDDIVKKIDNYTMLYGDAAVKISIDNTISNTPILEVIKGNRFEPVYKRNTLESVIFYSEYIVNKKHYLLHETYGKGYITYHLFDENDREVSPDTVPELEGVQDVTFGGDFMMCVIFKYWDSPKFEHRGKPLITNFDAFDSLDEILSLWPKGIRGSQPTKYFPLPMVRRDENGRLLKPDDNDTEFINGNMSDGNNKIEFIQPSFSVANYESSRIYFLEECLRDGKISAVSMGIDRNKIEENYSADRQKERLTGWTRSQRIDKLVKVLPKFIDLVLKTYENMNGLTIKDHPCQVIFDEFNTPDLDEVLDTLNKACPGKQLMSTKSCVDIIGNALNRDEKWKQEELVLIESESSFGGQDTEYFPSMTD